MSKIIITIDVDELEWDLSHQNDPDWFKNRIETDHSSALILVTDYGDTVVNLARGIIDDVRVEE